MSIKMKLLGGGITISLLLGAVLALTVYAFGSLSGGFSTVVEKSATGVDNSRTAESNIIQTNDDLSAVTGNMLAVVDDIHQTNMQVKVLERKIKKISATLVELNEQVGEAAEGMPDGDARYALEDTTDAIGDIEEIMRREALISLKRTVDKMQEFTRTIGTQADDIKRLNDGLGKVRELSSGVVTANQDIRSLSEAFSDEIGLSRNIIAGVLLVTVIVSLAGALMLTGAITRPLNRANEIARGIADGDLDQTVDITSSDEIGQLGRSMSVMIKNLKQNIDETRRRADEASRIRMALDVCSTNIIVADTEHSVIYQNSSSEQTLQNIQGALKTDIPQLDSSQFTGSSLSDFHTDPELQSHRLDQLGEMQQEELVAGGRHLRFIATPVFNQEKKRLGTALEWADRTNEVAMQEEEHARQEAEARVANENLRIRVALDNVSSSVMMADTERNILYLNRAAQQLFTNIEEDICKELPDFSAGQLLGSCIDAFHKDPAHQAELLEKLQQRYTSELEISGHVMRIVANPVTNDAGERLGTAVEWSDRTDEVAVETEVAAIVSAAQDGDLSQRIETANKEGFYNVLGTGINALIEQVEQIFNEMLDVMSAMAQGDLTHPINREYKGSFLSLKNNVNDTISNLRDILSHLRTDMDEVRNTADEIFTGNTNLSNRTEQQASSLEETAASMEELTSTVRNNADNAQQANQVSASARQLAEKGGEIVANAVQAMEQINASSNKIAEIIGVIDEIAFQTNLLALNASVEAARAGDQGRGFAVVATEVRNLASRSAEAAKEIKELIQDSVEKVEAGSELVNESGETLVEIVGGVKKVGDIIAEIAAASAEQSTGIDQVNQAVTSIDESTQQNAAMAEQTSAASAAMSGKAQELQKIVSRFKV